MEVFQKSLEVLEALFKKDSQLALATTAHNVPSLRVVDMYYTDGAFYIVTYAKSQKVQEIEANKHVALCKDLYRFQGEAYNIGHPLKKENKEIRQQLIKAFEPWYFAHNNEADENMCYVKVVPTTGFYYKDGTGYKVDFVNQTAETFPFEMNIMME